MSLMDEIQAALGKGESGAADGYERASEYATRDELAAALSGMFSDRSTPPYEDTVSQLFGSSNNFQRAGLLNTLLKAAGPAIAAAVAGGALKNVMAGGANAPQVAPADAAKVTPDQVQDIIKQARTAQPGIVDSIGKFYANNPQLVKAVGGAALLVLLSKMKDGMRQ